MTSAWLFPGQGSQYVGMAAAWLEASGVARQTFDEASDVLGFDVARLVTEGPEDVLADTYNQQPAVLATSVAVFRAGRDELPDPVYVAGHSLGEYSALVAAEALPFADAVRLVRERGRLMKLAGEMGPGRMAAVLGLDDAVVERVCAATDGVQVANYNAPGQVVISGTGGGVDAASASLADVGAKRVVPLPITIAAHSVLMEPVSEAFADAVASAPVADARFALMANTTAEPISSAPEITSELQRQLTESVRWSDGIRAMLANDVVSFYEIGPGSVLTGLTKRIAKSEGVPLERATSLDRPAP